MTVTWREILFFLILFGANLIQAITGFAGTLLAMPPSMQLLGVDEAKSVLAVLDQLSCLLIVLTGFRHINWKEFGKMAVLMVAGMFAGMKIFEAFPIQQLLTLYGVMILCIALWKLFGQRLMKKSGLSRVRGLSVYGVSVGGAAAHNCGQVAAAVLTLGNTAPLYYLPVLLGVSLFTGALTGLIAACLFRALGRTILWEV